MWNMMIFATFMWRLWKGVHWMSRFLKEENSGKMEEIGRYKSDRLQGSGQSEADKCRTCGEEDEHCEIRGEKDGGQQDRWTNRIKERDRCTVYNKTEYTPGL